MAEIQVSLSLEDLELARELAHARMEESVRHLSAHRPTARNLRAQLRGAAGEIACRVWLEGHGLLVARGFERDRPSDSDIEVNGVRIEVMTAQVAHRQITGFCVPPGKLAAARRRGAWGYVFVGTDASEEPAVVTIQAVARLADVDLDPTRETRVSERSPAVRNYVIRPNLLGDPMDLAAMLKDHSGHA